MRSLLERNAEYEGPGAEEEEGYGDDAREEEEMTAMLNMRTVLPLEVVGEERKQEHSNRSEFDEDASDKEECKHKFCDTEDGRIVSALLQPKRFKQRAVLVSSLSERVPTEVEKDNTERDAEEKGGECGG